MISLFVEHRAIAAAPNILCRVCVFSFILYFDIRMNWHCQVLWEPSHLVRSQMLTLDKKFPLLGLSREFILIYDFKISTYSHHNMTSKFLLSRSRRTSMTWCWTHWTPESPTEMQSVAGWTPKPNVGGSGALPWNRHAMVNTKMNLKVVF